MTTGELVSGKAISSVTINGVSSKEFEITIYGEEAVLDSIDCVPVTIDVNGQGNNGSKTSNVTISKPAGVRSVSDESVSIVLNFGEAKQKTITINRIQPRNVPNGLAANLSNPDDKVVEVQVIGVESVINEIDENSITAYVDLTGLTIGTYSVMVQVEGPDSRLQYVVTKNVNVILSKAE